MTLTRISVEAARAYALRVLGQAGLSCRDAELVADALVESSLRGVDSHGVVVLLPRYAAQARSGAVAADAEPVVADGRGAVAVVDGQNVLGLRAARAALETAIERALQHGLGAVAVRNVGYLGALWWCVRPAAERGLIGIAATNSMACVAPFGGREPLHGTNPIAVAVPDDEDGFLVDMRTNALRMADYWESVRSGGALPAGAILRRDGSPTTDPAEIDDAVYLPLAGPKGYGLALVVDVVTAALAGAPIGRDVSAEMEDSELSAFFLVLDPAAFGPRERFASAVARLAAQARKTTPLDPAAPVRLPGDRSWEERRRRLAAGIPVDAVLWRQARAALADLGVDVADPLSA